jgi:hypothetical protein
MPKPATGDTAPNPTFNATPQKRKAAQLDVRFLAALNVGQGVQQTDRRPYNALYSTIITFNLDIFGTRHDAQMEDTFSTTASELPS